MKQRLIALALGLALTACSTSSQALPTKSQTALEWQKYEDPSATGFHVYYKKPEDVGYVDARRITLARNSTFIVNAPTNHVLALAPVLTPRSGLLCFRMTAFDAGNRESEFSNEVCGWFGIVAPAAVKTVE